MEIYLTKKKWIEETNLYYFKHRIDKINDEIQFTLYYNAHLGCPFGLWSYNTAIYTAFLNEKDFKYLNSISNYTKHFTPTTIEISTPFYKKMAEEKEETYKRLFNSNSGTLEHLGIDCILRVFFDYTRENSTNKMIIDKNNSCEVLRDFLFTEKAEQLFNQRGFTLKIMQDGDLKYVVIF